MLEAAGGFDALPHARKLECLQELAQDSLELYEVGDAESANAREPLGECHLPCG